MTALKITHTSPHGARNVLHTLGKLFPKISLDSWWWLVIEYLYQVPDPSPRSRTKPMEVICVGLPRSGTESLQQALLALGYDHTYHGWNMIFDEECYCQGWVKLCRKKWFGAPDGECTITTAEFDVLLGHSVAVTDAASSVFAVEMIAAYPEAKVILNTRTDLEAWHTSAIKTLILANESWAFWLASWFDKECFWVYHAFERFLWPLLFRAPDGDMTAAIRRNGKWIYQEHCNMIRGLVPQDRLLEWTTDDGWEPLCQFLNKPVPDIEFPHVNTKAGGWKAREKQSLERWIRRAFVKMYLMCVLCVGAFAYGIAHSA